MEILWELPGCSAYSHTVMVDTDKFFCSIYLATWKKKASRQGFLHLMCAQDGREERGRATEFLLKWLCL